MSSPEPVPRPARAHGPAGGLGAILAFAVLALLWWQCGNLERTTADATVRDGELWLYASDLAPGQTFDGRVRLRGGAKLAITRVTVRGFDAASTPQVVLDRPVRWGDSLDVKTRSYRGGAAIPVHDGEDEVTFRVRVPATVQPGWRLDLDVEVEYAVAETTLSRFERVDRMARFRVPVSFSSPAASVARRVGKGVAALALWAAMLVAPVVALRRRWRTAGVALVVVGFVGGWPATAILGGHALRVHGAWWWITCAAVAMACAGLALWWTRGDHLARYRLVPRRVAGGPGDAYRANDQPPAVRSMADLERAWMADGLAVYRDGDELVVFVAEGGEARVSLAGGEQVGDGVPLELRSDRAELVERLARAASGVLGESRIELVEDSKRGDE